MRKHLMLIGGEGVAPSSGVWFESFNPYTGEPWALVPRANADDVDRAVTAARKAFTGRDWRGLTATARGKLLFKLADLIAARADDLAEIETRDNGKLILEMRAQLRYLPEWFRYFRPGEERVDRHERHRRESFHRALRAGA